MIVPLRRLLPLAVVAAIAAACSTPATASPSASQPDASEPAEGTIVVYSGRSEELVGPLFEQFTEDTGIEVEARYGDSAEMASLILTEGENSPADVFFTQDAGALGAVAEEGLLTTLGEDLLGRVDERFRSASGEWVGVSGRARVVAYNTEALTEADLPDSILDFTDPEWAGRIGWAPTNGSFQAFVTALRVIEGEDAAREWLEGIQANDPMVYDGNAAALEAVAAGEVDVAFINHYYLHQRLAEEPDSAAANHFLTDGDPGALVNVAGAGILGRRRTPPRPRRSSSGSLSARGAGVLRHGDLRVPARSRASRPIRRSRRSARSARPRSTCPSCRISRARWSCSGEVGAIVGCPANGPTARPRPRAPAPPAWLVGAGVLVALLALVPIAYLVVVATSGGEPALELLLRDRTLAILVRTLALAATVTAASVLIGVPIAWLTTRTDLPGRRAWTILTALPLVVPSYVGGYAMVAAFGPRGALQSLLEPFGVERLPELYGFPGAALTLTLFSFPYVVLGVRGALLRLDPAYEEVSRSLGRGRGRRSGP